MNVLRDYRCKHCFFEFEKKANINEPVPCPKCHGETVIVYKNPPSFKVKGFNAENGYS